ncbi:putative bifunctional diguanylate cyclase/phosphodiesterase [Thiohalobacter sp.]|uniref:putative bifunctional diguanylate cyclase/phosphodiesterase n=1 Tax=Thiohalobacter sp. TaxID=2025948 RepID=UPI00263A0207|nr:GGDEF domain-containing phosphodiesterase [Thiohalobacter sp.]
MDSDFYAELLRAYLDSANDAIFVLCDELKFLACNRLMQQWLGRDEAELTRHNRRRPITELLGDRQAAELFRSAVKAVFASGAPRRFECRIRPHRGGERWVEFNVTRVDVESGDMVMVVARDVSERRAHLARIEQQATHDALTGLPNRVYLNRYLTRQAESPHALLVIDLDRFKEINAAYGHAAGDELLRILTTRLEAAVDAAGWTARVGGDEFVVVLPGQTPEQAWVTADRLRHVLAEPAQIGIWRVRVEVTLGLACSPQHGSLRQLLVRAESALYHARGEHAPAAMYEGAWHRDAVRQVKLLTALHEGLAAGEIEPFYQPILPMREAAAPRVEALARWRHPSRGLVSPEAFIGLAEQSGLIWPLTRRVLECALSQCAPLLRDGRIASLSLNLSPRCLIETLPESLDAALTLHGLPPSALILELTESAAMAHSPREARVLDTLAQMGVRLAIDDFGTGHSSLIKLKQLPLSELKIDRSFVHDCTRNPEDAVIVETSVRLAHSLALDVVAEGIEDADTWACLRELGCDFGQGFLMAEPMPLAALEDWLAGARGRRRRGRDD